jgi:hypothetical protein
LVYRYRLRRGESLRNVYFMGAQEPCKSGTTVLKAEIDEEVCAILNATPRGPSTGRTAIKAINQFWR